ncbi:MAG: DUF1501 domain-containing protein [Aquabacterium sp.]|nr:MAG: DUF1501 domain-containing protein [Aquabacterium sp.]
MNKQDLSRRRFLRWSAAGTAASALGVGSLATLLIPARSAWAVDYKALVCVFLYGGNDGMNTIVPTDSRYTQYNTVRGALALPQSSLVGLNGVPFGLHPSLAALQPVWASGQMATVFNVGPLAVPFADKAAYRAATVAAGTLPESLFSHSDQQILWQTASTSSQTRTGWGGRAASAMSTVQPVIAVGGNGHYGLSATRAQLAVPSSPGSDFNASGLNDPWTVNVKRKAAIDALYAADGADVALSQAYATQMRDAFVVSSSLEPLIKQTPATTTPPATLQTINAAFSSLISNGQVQGRLAQQLYQTAKLIANNATVGGNRQLYFADHGGFDTHGDQIGATSLVGTHADLLKQLGDAVAAFHNAMNALGLGQQVTLFTQSDFGRTFAPNNSRGTDHAWGNHHMVLGGAVHGGTYGTYPQLDLAGPDDVGVQSWERQGRWIPSTSVEQYAAPMLRWFGASNGQLASILPNLSRFTAPALTFV